jgi:hypothetical protein
MTFVDQIESEWDSEGFLGKLRIGNFIPEEALRFLQILRSIEIPDGSHVPKRVVSLFWCLPSFLIWQRDRVAEKGGDIKVYEHFVTEVHNTLEAVLGVP